MDVSEHLRSNLSSLECLLQVSGIVYSRQKQPKRTLPKLCVSQWCLDQCAECGVCSRAVGNPLEPSDPFLLCTHLQFSIHGLFPPAVSVRRFTGKKFFFSAYKTLYSNSDLPPALTYSKCTNLEC